jgi:hypothetical protein
MNSISYVVNLLGPALASAAMTVALSLPFFIGICLLFLAVPVVSLLPIPRHRSEILQPGTGNDEQRRPLISSPVLKAQSSTSPVWLSILERVGTLFSVVTSRSRNLGLLLAGFFLTALASSDTKLLAQYISKRYSWTFASAGYLLSAKAVVNFVLLTFVVPATLRSARSYAVSSDRANLRYARICLVVSVLGALAIGLARAIWLLFPSLLLYALGSALPVFTLSLLKSPSIAAKAEDEEHDSTETHLFSIVMMVKTLGSLFGAPLMAILWVRGIAAGEAALGIPYFVSAACYLAAIGVFSAIKVRYR